MLSALVMIITECVKQEYLKSVLMYVLLQMQVGCKKELLQENKQGVRFRNVCDSYTNCILFEVLLLIFVGTSACSEVVFFFDNSKWQTTTCTFTEC